MTDTPVSEAVERDEHWRAHALRGDRLLDEKDAQIARLTEQVRMAREWLERIKSITPPPRAGATAIARAVLLAVREPDDFTALTGAIARASSEADSDIERASVTFTAMIDAILSPTDGGER